MTPEQKGLTDERALRLVMTNALTGTEFMMECMEALSRTTKYSRELKMYGERFKKEVEKYSNAEIQVLLDYDELAAYEHMRKLSKTIRAAVYLEPSSLAALAELIKRLTDDPDIVCYQLGILKGNRAEMAELTEKQNLLNKIVEMDIEEVRAVENFLNK